jgi:hypothetical protein
MRTKTLICAAGLAAFMAIPAMAQNVYSLNVVGYVNQTYQPGFQMVANPLDLDGTGIHNTIGTVFSNSMPANTIVYKWNSGWVPYTFAKGAWTPNSTASINPGESVFVKLPGAVSWTNTMVGTVLQGTLTNNYIPALGGYCALSSIVPITGLLQSNTNLNYIPKASDVVYKWSNGWVPFTFAKGAWTPAQPTNNVGEGFFLKTSAGQGWTNRLTVQ